MLTFDARLKHNDVTASEMNDQPIKPIRKTRADGQKSGMAGELFVAAELFKRELQGSITLGNAKSIDLFAVNDKGSSFRIQVKTLRSRNYFLIDLERVDAACWYVFVVLNNPKTPPDYYIVPGIDLRSEPKRFGKWFADYKKMPGIHPKDLTDYHDKW